MKKKNKSKWKKKDVIIAIVVITLYIVYQVGIIILRDRFKNENYDNNKIAKISINGVKLFDDSSKLKGEMSPFGSYLNVEKNIQYDIDDNNRIIRIELLLYNDYGKEADILYNDKQLKTKKDFDTLLGKGKITKEYETTYVKYRDGNLVLVVDFIKNKIDRVTIEKTERKLFGIIRIEFE